ncbi:MAG: glycosyltransferase family 4 protein [Patescibacteria group bacterium]
MRICIVVDNLNPKVGWGRQALNVSEQFRAYGHDVGFIVEKEDSLNFPQLAVPLRLSVKNLLFLPLTLLRIRNFIKTYDVILCYDVNPNAIILNMANLGQKRKVVIHALATYSLLGRGTPVRNFFMRWAYRRAKKVLVISEFTKRQIEKSGFKLTGEVIVPVGVDTNFFHPILSDEKIAQYPFVLTVGALKPRKGYHISIPAFKVIAEEFPDLKYVIIGYQNMASYFKELKDLVADFGLKDRVIFLEKISDNDLLKYYNSAELFVMTSITEPDTVEGFGMVYLEAGACGTPVVGAYNTGAEAAISDNINGFLVKHDPVEIANAMRKILLDKNLAKILGTNGIKRAKEFNWDNIAKLYLKNLLD